ncbi:hypothetical protein VNO77_02612 [Canavalia gladiata]|uniref:Uncharacterized protein n=1 Tax=Canavalia gladiata TaxID=3824 RepID=A0AAN9R370_CANGL
MPRQRVPVVATTLKTLTIAFLISSIWKMKRDIYMHLVPSRASLSRSWLRWNAPLEDSILLNVDGRYSGIICHNSIRWLLGGFYEHIGVTDNVHTELMAILQRMKLA